MNIKQLLQKKFPEETAICVSTGINIDYIKKIGVTLAWKMSLSRAQKYDKIFIVGVDNAEINYKSPMNGIDIWSQTKQKGKYLIAEIEEVISLSEIKSMSIAGSPHKKLKEMIDRQSFFTPNLLYEKNFNGERLVIIFNEQTVIEGNLKDDFKGLSNPVCYIESEK